jgi:hypothetical protein
VNEDANFASLYQSEPGRFAGIPSRHGMGPCLFGPPFKDGRALGIAWNWLLPCLVNGNRIRGVCGGSGIARSGQTSKWEARPVMSSM